MRQRFGFNSVPRYAFIILLVVAGFVLSPHARATAILRISADDGLTWTNIIDNGPLDQDTNSGTILFNGTGVGFSGVFVATSQYRIDVPAYLDLNCSLFSASRPLTFQYTDNGFSRFIGRFQSSIGGNTSALVSCKTYVDTTGGLFGGTLLANTDGLTGDFTWNSNSDPFSLYSYSLTSEVKMTAPGGSTSFDMLLEAYEPVAPTILTPTISQGGIHLSFETEVGFTYVLQSNNTPVGGEWVGVQSIDGTGDIVTLVDPLSNGPAKFYRVSVH